MWGYLKYKGLMRLNKNVFSAYSTNTEWTSSKAFKAIGNAFPYGIDMYEHPHRNCNEPCKLWRHTPGKFLCVASSKCRQTGQCRQKLSRNERGYSWQLRSVDLPLGVEVNPEAYLCTLLRNVQTFGCLTLGRIVTVDQLLTRSNHGA